MAIVKVFDVNGARELNCFDTLDNVPYEEEVVEDDVLEEKNPFE